MEQTYDGTLLGIQHHTLLLLLPAAFPPNFLLCLSLSRQAFEYGVGYLEAG
jgi:hypothetical protein